MQCGGLTLLIFNEMTSILKPYSTLRYPPSLIVDRPPALAFVIPTQFMQKAPRIAILALLALMQLFAPLVHAHVGGTDFNGTIHVPGLEFLVKARTHSAQAFSEKGCFDFIIGLANGFRDLRDGTKNLPDTDFNSPAIHLLSAILPKASGSRPLLSHLNFPSPFWPAFSPRAPPLFG